MVWIPGTGWFASRERRDSEQGNERWPVSAAVTMLVHRRSPWDSPQAHSKCQLMNKWEELLAKKTVSEMKDLHLVQCLTKGLNIYWRVWHVHSFIQQSISWTTPRSRAFQKDIRFTRATIHTWSLLWRNLGSRINSSTMIESSEHWHRQPSKRFEFEVRKTSKSSSSPFSWSLWTSFFHALIGNQSQGLKPFLHELITNVFVLICLPSFCLPPRHHLYINNQPAL